MSAAAELDLLYPLSLFHRDAGHPLPAVELIAPDAMPEPYRSLLVHDGDMTSRLEAHHRGSLALRVLHREHTPGAYRREVILVVESSALPVEYGAIEINLDAFEPAVRDEIVRARLPLGGILNRHGVQYRSQPQAFFRLGSDAVMNGHFEVAGSHLFHGRSNLLLGPGGQLLARIVEVLRP
jgi:chorismate-pyruvate lyase